MPKASPIQTAFNAGEFSELLDGRVDIEGRGAALLTMENMVGIVQGPATRRPGSVFVGEVKTSANRTALLPFKFSDEQAYVVEVGDQYFRFFLNNGRLLSGGSTIVELATPYAQADLFDTNGTLQLRFSQSADVMYITHKDYAVRKLSRTSATTFTLTEVDFSDGPYLDTNVTSTTLTLGSTSGSVSVTASSTTGINNDTGFQTTDVGRVIRWKDPAGEWTWLEITARSSTTQVTATIKGQNPSAGTATEDWRLGLYSDTTGHPKVVTFHENRLGFGGSASEPERIDMSNSGDFENFAPSEVDGTVTDSNAFRETLAADTVSIVNWMLSTDNGLMAGTQDTEFVIRGSVDNEVLTPSNKKGTPSGDTGSAFIKPIRVDGAVLYVQSSRKKLHELAYSFQDDGFKSPNLTVRNPGITGSGITEMAFQQEPHNILWAVRDDGRMLGLTYERNDGVVGWHRHTLAGTFDSGAAVVESIATIPSTTTGSEELWLIVKRTIDGATVRYVEYLSQFYDENIEAEDAIMMDSSLTYSGAATTSISGLDHLEGESVLIYADGKKKPQATVSSGAITLPEEATKVVVGLPMTWRMKGLRIEAGAQDGTAQGKIKRIHRVKFRFYKSFDVQYGDEPNPVDMEFGESVLSSDAPALFSGDVRVDWPGEYDRDGFVEIYGSGPFPVTVLSWMPTVVTQDES